MCSSDLRIRTADLLRRAGDAGPHDRTDLLNEVVVENRGVADAVASRFRDRGVPLEDLQQTAYEGLLKAVRRFDPQVSEDLLTFAVPTIRGEIQRYFRDHGWVVRPPRRLQQLRGEVQGAVEDLEQALGRTPTAEEVSGRLGIECSEYREALEAQAAQRPASLDQEVGDDGPMNLGDLIRADRGTEPTVDHVVVADLMAGLGDRDRLLIRLRFVHDLTQSQIGDRLGITQMQVSRRLSAVLRRMREDLER